MNNHPLIGRTLERADTGETLGVVAHIYTPDNYEDALAVIVRDDGTFGRASLCPRSAWRVRMEPATEHVEPAKPAPVERKLLEREVERANNNLRAFIALRARVADLEEQLAGVRVEARAVKGDRASGDGTAYRLTPRYDGGVCILIEAGCATTTAFVSRADILDAAGIRGDL